MAVLLADAPNNVPLSETADNLSGVYESP